jgi:hypothetical protein
LLSSINNHCHRMLVTHPRIGVSLLHLSRQGRFRSGSWDSSPLSLRLITPRVGLRQSKSGLSIASEGSVYSGIWLSGSSGSVFVPCEEERSERQAVESTEEGMDSGLEKLSGTISAFLCPPDRCKLSSLPESVHCSRDDTRRSLQAFRAIRKWMLSL